MRTTTDDSRTPTSHRRTDAHQREYSVSYSTGRHSRGAAGHEPGRLPFLTSGGGRLRDPPGQDATSIFAAGIAANATRRAIHQG